MTLMLGLKKKLKGNLSFFLLLLFFGIYLFYKKTHDNIIYPEGNYLFYGIFTTGVLVSLILIRKCNWLNESSIFEMILVSIFAGYIWAVLIFIPLDKYNVNYFSLNSQVQTVNCSISSISNSRMSRGMYISFENKKIFIRGHRPIFNDFKRGQKNIDNHFVEVAYKKGWLNSIILLEKKIKKETRP